MSTIEASPHRFDNMVAHLVKFLTNQGHEEIVTSFEMVSPFLNENLIMHFSSPDNYQTTLSTFMKFYSKLTEI